MSEITEQAEIRAMFADTISELVGGTPAEFVAFITRQTAKWAAVVKTANPQPE